MLKKTKFSLRKLVYILLGCAIMSVGAFFFNMPANIAAGGVTGFSQIIKHIIPGINVGLVMMVLNVLILIAGAYFLGKEFGLYTIVGSFGYSTFVGILDSLIKLDGPIIKDSLVNVVIGGALIGIGLSIVFMENASTGGTDVIAKIIERYTNYSVSIGMIIADSIVIIFAALVFGLDSGIYALISLFITSYTVDYAITGFNSKIAMTIISDEIDKINNFISTEIVRGTTLYKAVGGYTKKDKFILVTVVDRKQYIKIRRFIQEVDEEAFVYTSNISEVIGYGFSREFIHAKVGDNTKITD